MPATVKVWDPFVRVFHWSLVASFAVAWLSAEEWDKLHEWSGYVAATLIALRVLWGFVGPHYARFSQFVTVPARAVNYLMDFAANNGRRYLGHSPAGAVMIVALLAGTAALCISGWAATLPSFRRAEWLEESHTVLANVVLLLVGLHIAGVILVSLRHKENLVKAMFTGNKRAMANPDTE